MIEDLLRDSEAKRELILRGDDTKAIALLIHGELISNSLDRVSRELRRIGMGETSSPGALEAIGMAIAGSRDGGPFQDGLRGPLERIAEALMAIAHKEED